MPQYGIWAVCIGLLGLNAALIAGCAARKRKQPGREEPGMPPEGETAAHGDAAAQFLPTELLHMMGICSPSADLPGILKEQKEMEAVIFNGNITGFRERIHEADGRDAYRFINRTLSFLIPAVCRNGGIIDSFQDAGIAALFTGDMADGLYAAVSACEEIIKSGDWENYRNFSVGLCYGPVTAGVVGYGQKLSVLTLSAYTGFGAFLQGIGPKYYARILAAESYVSRIDGFEKNYNHRLLGSVYIRVTGSGEKIYDVFDGDEAEVRNRKRKTKMIFEKGVRLFAAREFAESRTYFIETLKADRNDKAAREYVFLCDKYGGLPPEKAESADIYIEHL